MRSNRDSELLELGFVTLHPQPRGIGESTGLGDNVTALAQADDIAKVTEKLAAGETVVRGHAFGHFIARVVASVYPSCVGESS